MEGTQIPEAKRARRSTSALQTPSATVESCAAAKQAGQPQQQQQRGVVPEHSPSAAGAPSRSMTARPEGALGQDEDDPLFDDPEEVAGEELEGLLRLSPPTTSSEPVVAQIKQHAIDHPETIRDFIKRTAVRLAKESGCIHSEPLVTWKEDREATTCGQYQAHVLSGVDMQVSSPGTTEHAGSATSSTAAV